MNTDLPQLLRVLPILVLAALLEVGGDAAMRFGLQGRRVGFPLAILLLTTYGLVVNLPKWDFGRLMGVYIALFFIVSQVIAVAVYHEKVNTSILAGGALIVIGGLTLTFWHPQ